VAATSGVPRNNTLATFLFFSSSPSEEESGSGGDVNDDDDDDDAYSTREEEYEWIRTRAQDDDAGEERATMERVDERRRIPRRSATVVVPDWNPWHGRRKTRAEEKHAIVETNNAATTIDARRWWFVGVNVELFMEQARRCGA
jgi:hypothetical protein